MYGNAILTKVRGKMAGSLQSMSLMTQMVICSDENGMGHKVVGGNASKYNSGETTTSYPCMLQEK